MLSSSNTSTSSRLSGDIEFRLLFFSMTPNERTVCRHITETVLPSFRHACAERGARLVLVDPQSEGMGGASFSATHVARTLRELHGRTFFIGVIGSPNNTSLNAAGCPELQSLVDTSPGLADALRRGLSAGDIVIREGVVRRPERMKHRAAFFLPGRESNTVERRRDRQFLSTLKRDIRRGDFPIREFNTTDQLIARVHECLHHWLDHWFPADEFDLRVASERQDHEAFRTAYCPTPTYMQRPCTISVLDAFVDQDAMGPLWVVGPSGIGKTSLLVNWVRRFRQENPNTFLIEHYVGATLSSRNLIGFMRRVLWQLKQEFAIAADVPVRTDDMVRAYNLWLSEQRNRPVVLVIDGIDQFEHLDDITRALPTFIAPHLRIIASSWHSPGMAQPDSLYAGQTIIVPGLTIKERQELMANDFRARHPLPLPTKLLRQVARIRAAHQAFHTQLVARVLTDPELTGQDVASRLERYERATDPDDLLDLLLEDVANRCTGLPAGAFLTRIWASENGLTMDELSIICGINGIPDATCAEALVAAFDPCLANRNGAYLLSHSHIAAAIERRYLGGKDDRRNAHLALADLFATMRIGPRQALALCWQLKQAGAAPRLYAELSRVDTLAAFLTAGREYELLMYWSGQDAKEMEQLYRTGLKQHARYVSQSSISMSEARMLVARFLHLAGCFNAAADLLGKEYIAMRKRSPANYEYVSCLSLFADTKLALGKMARARELLRSALDILKNLGLAQSIEYAETHRRLAYVLDAEGRHDDALESLNTTNDILCRKLGRLDERCLRNAADRGAVFYKLERYDAAEDLLRTTLHDCENTVGEYHTLTLEVLNSLGAVYERQALLAASAWNDADAPPARWLAAARTCRERALAISERLFPAGHPDTTARMINLGVQLRMERNYGGAEALYRKALAYDKQTFGEIHPRIVGLLINLTSVLRLQGGNEQLEKALEILHQTLKIRKRLRDSTDMDVADIELNLASLLKQMGRFKQALKYYQRGLPVRVMRYGLYHRRTREALGGLADLMAKLGQSYVKNRAQTPQYIKRRRGDDAHRAGKQAEGDTDVLAQARQAAAQGDLAKARRLCRELIARYRRSGNATAPDLLQPLELLASCMMPPVPS